MYFNRYHLENKKGGKKGWAVPSFFVCRSAFYFFVVFFAGFAAVFLAVPHAVPFDLQAIGLLLIRGYDFTISKSPKTVKWKLYL